MSSSQVRVLSITHVQPYQTMEPPRRECDHAAIKLSFFDTMFVAMPPIQRLFFYQDTGLPPFPSLVRSLRSSLATALAVFPPLAGKVAFVPSSGDVIVDCSPAVISPGVRFVEAETDIDMYRLAGDEEHDVGAFMRLVPELDVGRLPAPVLAVQVTRSAGLGGAVVAIGLSMYHAVADGRSLWQFMQTWAATAREGSPTAPGLVLPTFDRAAIRHPKAEEMAREFLRVSAPTLPEINLPPARTSPEELAHHRRRTFVLRADQIQSLKHNILQQSKTTDHKLWKPPTTFVVVSSLVWTSIIRAKALNHADDAYLVLSADCRRRLHPRIDEGFFGNCVKSCYARAMVGHLCGHDGLVHATTAIQKAIHESVEEPLADVEQWMGRRLKRPKGRTVFVGSSPRFMVYETDFGWGKPSRVELASMFRNDMVGLSAAREEGGVQVSVALDSAHMEVFEAIFMVPGAVPVHGQRLLCT